MEDTKYDMQGDEIDCKGTYYLVGGIAGILILIYMTIYN